MRFLLPFLLTVQLSFAAESTAGPFSHRLWDSVLTQYVSTDGFVDYRALKANSRELNDYVDLLARRSPDNAPQLFPSEAHRLAYWINAYNALIVHRVVENYPIDSIKDLGGFLSSVFDKTQTVGGKQLSHNDIEHEIIRKRFREPRIHFVLNCASRSCAPLRRRALTGENLEASLQEAAESFLNNPVNLRIDSTKGTVRLSKYFDWFEEDFLRWARESKSIQSPTVLDYVRFYLRPDKRELLQTRRRWRIRFFDYDWSLNSVPTSAGRTRLQDPSMVPTNPGGAAK